MTLPRVRPVSELYDRHAGEDIYVVGTGPSLRVFPLEMLEGRTVIGLNLAWRQVQVTYGLTIHPELNIPPLMSHENGAGPGAWVIKSSKLRPDDHARLAGLELYGFRADGRRNTQPPDEPSDAGRVLDWVRRPTDDFLYQWSSISQTGVNLAANLGARNVFLVGCDNAPLGNSHHVDSQHTRWKGVDPAHRYRQYYEGLAEVRNALASRDVNVLSLTPFVTLGHVEEDFARLCVEHGHPVTVASEDISQRLEWRQRVRARASGVLRR